MHAYYETLTVGPSHNYYFGREDADLTAWVEYFCRGMASSFRSVQAYDRIGGNAGCLALAPPTRSAAAYRPHAVPTITSRDVESLFSISQRMARLLLKRWAESGFLVVVDPARKSRKYALNEPGQRFAGRVTP